MSGELGKASLDLEANLGPFERNLETAHAAGDRLQHALDGLAAVADVCQKALNDVKLDASHAAESRISAEQILRGVHGISDESRMAARELDKVKLGSEQASETEVAGAVIDHELDNIHDKAERTQRALDGVRLRLAGARVGGGSNRPGYGVGPFGAGYGRLGLVGTGIGLGVLAGPAAAPAALGLLAAIPALATAGAGALGTLMLAFHGVGKAISGDKKAFSDLTPAAKQFVLTVRSLDGFYDRLRQIAAKSLFPGLTVGLKAALSPGTIGVISKAVMELGHAIGQAGAQWGRYFGSPEFQSIFGPLMQSAARNIGKLSDTLLHLFDALGVIGRAAIPFVNWLSDMVDKGAKLADSWIHAKDASGALAHGMNEARQSLRLMGGLVGALLKVIIALGQALYPVARVAVKDLTGGLNALARIIDQNKNGIRDFVRGALDALVAAVKIAWPIVVDLAKALGAVARAIGGWKTAFAIIISGFLATKFFILGKSIYGVAKSVAGIGSAAVAAEGEAVPAITAIGVAASAAALGGVAVLTAGLIASYIIVQKLSAALGSLPTDKQAVAGVSERFRKRHPKLTGEYQKYLYEQGQFDPATGQFVPQPGHHALTFMQWLQKYHPESVPGSGASGSSSPKGPKPGTHAWYMKYLGFDPTKAGKDNPFGPPPPFTKNLGTSGASTSPIPGSVQRFDALAARQDQAAAALNYAGKRARAHLEKEISDYQSADKILHEKLKAATGKKRTELYNALTSNLKKIAEARKRMGDALTKERQSQLNLALDQAKLAVENATEGSKAWDKAITAEEKALKAEISYWAKRSKNDKLSSDARDAALRKELDYEKQLKGLLTQRNQAVAANEAQFLQTWNDIQNTFAPNATPFGPQPSSSGKTDTHLHDIKQATRDTAAHLKAMRHKHRHPGSHAAHDAAMAVGG